MFSKLNVRLGVESLEDRVLATSGLTTVAPIQTSQSTTSVMQTTSSAIQILGLYSHGAVGGHIDYQRVFGLQHNETLVRAGARKLRRRNAKK